MVCSRSRPGVCNPRRPARQGTESTDSPAASGWGVAALPASPSWIASRWQRLRLRQRIGHHFVREAAAGGQGFKFEALQVELGEVQGQQPQPQHQEAQQQRSIALALDRYEQQQAAARQPEQAEAGRQDVEAAHPQP